MIKEPRGKKNLNILCVGTLPPQPGGSAIFYYQLLVALARREHKVRVIAPITPEALQSGDHFAISHPELHVSRYIVPYFDVAPPIPFPREYREQERVQLEEKLPVMISEDRPDVILIGRESFAWDVPEIARNQKIPCVMLIRGGSRTSRLLSGSYPDDLAHCLLEEYRKVDLIVAVAVHLVDGLKRLGLDEIMMIPNAVDLARFFPRPKNVSLLRELAVQEDDVVVMHVANLQERKRSLDLVSLAEMTSRESPRLMYVILGDGPLRKVMEQACRDRNLSQRFRFLGWVDYSRIPGYINIADLIVMPSESEGLSRVYLETQACGRVILASDIPPAREMIIDGETGLLFRMGDLHDLAAKTLLAARDPALRRVVGMKAREEVKAYALDSIADKYSTILQDVVHHYRR